jgi:dihydroorotate dehydrogenase electron transfer subunit
MKQSVFEIQSNIPLTKDVYRLVLSGDTSAVTAPGQFVEIAIPGKFLRRPISVSDWDAEHLTLIYRVVGQGTQQMSAMVPGAKLDLLTGLGNGYDLTCCGEHPVLIGGGVGVPPLYALCRQLLEAGKEPQVILGFNKKEEIFLEDAFRSLGAETHIATADGSVGTKGFVTDVLSKLDYSYFYACGPLPMFRAIEKIAASGGQYSMEERMGCGFGACMGCSIQTRSGAKRVCKDGPVFRREEVFFQ